MSKAAQIRELLDTCTPKEIAEQVVCSTDYVRAVRGRHERPEVGRSWSERYRQSEAYKAWNREKSRRWRLNQRQLRQLQPA